ncbi:MAG TPA: hypothetical protein VLB68_12585 [Pyrinomonadaceae bacterium]|nr:hypothetical protein [Pyrinomonadaceae bacterium]
MHKFSKFAVCKLFLGLLITAGFVMVPALAIGQTSAEQATQGVTISGKVKTASASALVILDSQNAEQTVVIDAKTKIIKAGKPATAADIKADDAVVVVAAKGDNDSWTAKTVTIGS